MTMMMMMMTSIRMTDNDMMMRTKVKVHQAGKGARRIKQCKVGIGTREHNPMAFYAPTPR